ncbi:MAG: glycosyltransferase family 4 protein [Phycisphaerae bacterium]|nr:glycosyltransferase family 4 protein [Phycisphaerae bacterium]
MNIAILAAGAGGMYCGSCMRDNTLAAALIRAGHRVSLIPLYTPLRTDERDVSISRVFYGGVNVYLQHASGFFRRTPRWIDWLFDRRWLLRLAGRRAGSTDPRSLGPLTISVLDGEDGSMRKELARLLRYLADDVQPDVVLLPNAMFVGVAGALKRRLGVPIVCELAGEDIFLDQLPDRHRSRAYAIIRDAAANVARFTAASRYYADHFAPRIGVAADRVDVVYPGLRMDDFPAAPPPPADRRPTVGYLARVCAAKGLDHLLAAFALLRARPGFESAELRTAGWLGPGDEPWYRDAVRAAALGDSHVHLGEVDRAGKIALLHGIDVFSVPARFPEPKGIYVLEALACGVPVVQPASGSFPELIAATGGGLLVPPGDAPALADALADLLRDRARRESLGAAGRASVAARFTDAQMAGNMLKVFRKAGARGQ